MKPSTMILLANRPDTHKLDHEYTVGDRFRDRRGREHYDDGRFAPKSDMYVVRGDMDEFEDRRYHRREDGRFAPKGTLPEYEHHETRANYPLTPYVPPVYHDDMDMRDREIRPMGRIGFDPTRHEVKSDYHTNAAYMPMDETEHRKSDRMAGHAKSYGTMPMTQDIAEEWAANLKNEDGTKGPHWTIDQIKQLMMQKGIQGDPWTFYAIMNAMYSDYCAIMKKHGCHTAEMYADMALAWINDKDAMPGKATSYYEHIMKK